MATRLTCHTCQAGLVPSWTGLRCPRLGACGRGGLTETAWSVLPHHLAVLLPSGIPA